jgi:hypothetical protein
MVDAANALPANALPVNPLPENATEPSQTAADAAPWVSMSVKPVGSPVTEADLAALPEPVRRYFRHTGVIGKPRIAAFALTLRARLRDSAEAPWRTVVMRQYNRVDAPARVVLIAMQGMPVSAVDSYVAGRGRMHITLANALPIADSAGAEMDSSALVTFLNDLVFCPLAAFSLPLRWQAIDDAHAKLSLTDGGRTVTALLTFADDGRLVDWQSDDRYADVKGSALKDHWSTPMTREAVVSGLIVPVAGEAIHDYDGKPFVYVDLESVEHLDLGAKALP